MTNRDMAVLLFGKLLDQTPVWVDSIMGQQVTVRAIERDGNGRFLVYDHEGNDRMAEEYLLTNPGRPESGREGR